MKWILVAVLFAILGISYSEPNCNACNRRIEYLCGKTVSNGREIYCTFSNPCEMERHACLHREEWRKFSTGRCTRDSAACRR
ncbi:hypothetical protein KR009_001720 [Drosophila setifemur]|nr:hypothetical protein KR009_001720 [Drosophila setifemur]